MKGLFSKVLKRSATSATAPVPTADFKGSSLDAQRLRSHQRFGDSGTCAGQDPAERVAGYAHHSGRRFLIKTFEIGQPDGLQFFQGEGHFACGRQTLGYKRGDGRKS